MTDYEIYPASLESICQERGIERYLKEADRDAIPAADFAGPDRTFPCDTQAHVDAAAHLVGHADNPDAVKAKIIAIAKKHGFTLPKAWQDDDDKQDTTPQERSMTIKETTLPRAALSANHEPMSGMHTHTHSAHGSQGDDATHEHEHSHDGDNNHDHQHAEERLASPTVIATSERQYSIYLPLVRTDATKREVWGQATAEVPDSYGTIFGYYPDAWKQWRGNIREQHDPKKAVGKRFGLECNDLSRSIHVGSRVSRGAQDTWLKVEDDVLTGYSASIIPDPEFGNDPKHWPKKEYEGKLYPYLPRYTVAELSLVDNPACPGCNIQIVRADGFATDVLDLADEETTAPTEPVSPPGVLARAGARVSNDTRDAMHKGIGHTLKAAVSQMQNCNCPDCQMAMKLIDPDGDGDIDIGGYDDPDQDWQALYGQQPNTEDMERAIVGIVERSLQPVYTRLQGIAGALARNNPMHTTSALETLITDAITRAVEGATAASASNLSEVRADLSAVKATVERIDATPVPGAPVMNARAVLPRPVEKTLATDPYARPERSGSAVADAIAALSQTGYLDTVDKQVDAVAAGLAAQRRR